MSTPTSRKLGKLIRAKREGGGLSQTELASRAGVAQPSVSHWERGIKVPTLSSLFRLRDALGVPPDEFSVWLELGNEAASAAGVAGSDLRPTPTEDAGAA